MKINILFKTGKTNPEWKVYYKYIDIIMRESTGRILRNDPSTRVKKYM